MRAPKISIVSVVFNAERTIEKTIQSVVALEYPLVEYIIVDGGSSDRTLEIIDRYRESISHIISEPDDGIYDAMNKGLRLATGEFVWFLNAGDVAASAHCLDEIIESDPLPDFFYSDTVLINPSGSLFKIRYAPDSMSLDQMTLGMAVSHQSFIPRTHLVELYDTELRLIADQKWIVSILRKAKRGYRLRVPLAQYLLGGVTHQRFIGCTLEKIRYTNTEFGLSYALILVVLMPYHITRFYAGQLFRRLLGRNHP